MDRGRLSSSSSLRGSSEAMWNGEGADLIRAIRANDARSVAVLIASGASVDTPWPDGQHSTALHLAASLETPDCLVELLKPSEKPQFTRNDNGDLPLHFAARRTRSIASVLLLVSIYGLAVDTVRGNRQGNTFFHALMMNARLGESDLVHLVNWLQERDGFDDSTVFNALNREGNTPYDVAVLHQQGHVDLLELLLNAGAATGSMLRDNERAALAQEEVAQRASLEQREAHLRQKVGKHFGHRQRKLVKCEAKMAKTLEKEVSARRKLRAKEIDAFRRVEAAQATALADALERQRMGEQAALLMQRVGRAYTERARSHALWKEREEAQRTAAAAMKAKAAARERIGRMESRHQQRKGAAERRSAKRDGDSRETRISTGPSAGQPQLRHEEHHHSSRREGTRKHRKSNRRESDGPLSGGRDRRSPVSTTKTMTTASMDSATGTMTESAEAGALTRSERTMGLRIWRAYQRYRLAKRTRAATLVQAHFRGFWIKESYKMVRAATITMQRAWRRFARQRWRERSAATDAIVSALRCAELCQRTQAFIAEATAYRQRERIRGITQAVTQLIWRENFCSAFREIVFMQKRRKPPPPPPNRWRARWRAHAKKIEPVVLIVQILISLFLLIYMGCVPRTRASRVHNKVDIAFICVQLVLTCLFPLCWWHLVDFAVVVTALVCAAVGAYGGVIVVTLLVLKIPVLVRLVFPNHSGTRTYCRAIRYCFLYLLALGPLALAGIGATVRGACLNHLLLTANGNWGRVFLHLWSSLSPQYAVQALVVNGVANLTAANSPVLNVAASVKWYEVQAENATQSMPQVDLVEFRMPTLQVVFCVFVLFIYTWSSTVVGTHSAIRSHYDISDETKLKANKHRFRNVSKMELLDAHRAANMEALGQQLDGVMWEADVRAAKEAVDASHYDHNANHTVHRFVRRVQDSVAKGNVKFEGRSRSLGSTHGETNNTATARQLGASFSSPTFDTARERTKWDCRNEDPRSRGTYDVEVIEAALGMQERKGRGERFFQRQWTGSVMERESTVVMVFMLVMASVRPNLFSMEIVFSSVLTVEFILSLYFLRIEFIFSHYWCLLLRIFCIVVGYVPPALPYVGFRVLRLMEGWSTIFMLPGMVRWGLLYCSLTFLTIWMVTFVASLQFAKDHAETAAAAAGAAAGGITTDADGNTTTAALQPIICEGTAHCLAISLRELAIPAWTPQHIRPREEAPLMATMIVAFQLFFIPFFLTIALHPLLQMSNFIGRFLRLVVQSLHKDVLDYLNSYLEGEAWYFHWRVKVGIPPSVITKLKMWVYDSRRRNTFFDSLRSLNSSMSSALIFPQATFVDPFIDARRACEEGEPEDCMNEIICKGNFATFEENEILDERTRKLRFRKLRKLGRRSALHILNVVLTLASVAFLWVSDASQQRYSAVTVAAVVVHILSIVSSVLVFPKDITVVLTIAGCASLLVSVVMILLPSKVFNEFYCLRYISFLRLGQLQVYPFVKIKRFIKTFLYSGVKILFPLLVMGALSYVTELLRAQIFLVTHSLDFGNATFDSNASEAWAPANLSYPDFLLLSRCSPYRLPNVNHTEAGGPVDTEGDDVLYSVACSRTRKPGVEETSNLFAHYFGEDAYIYYSIFCYWGLPALCVSSCLAYLFWSGANLLDTRRLTVKLVPLLEDPVTLAQFRPGIKYFRVVGNVVLILSLVCGCVLSPSTQASSDDLNLFFGLETGFTAFGLAEAVAGIVFAVHRSGSSWTSWMHMAEREGGLLVVVGDCVLLVCEVVELLYYTIALPLCATLLGERGDCFMSPGDYATFFITLRFVFLLRLLPRQYVLSLMHDSRVFFVAAAAIVTYFVGSASALADLAAATEGHRMTWRLWVEAFDDMFRHTFTSATPTSFGNRWLPLNASAVAAQMAATGTETLYISNDYAVDRLLFILSTIGKVVLACASGVGIAVALVPLRAHAVYPLPKKASLLYDALSGGLTSIVRFGAVHHDDMRPEARCKIQTRKFLRIFTPKGIPSWALPHLLEELNICRPARQRRFMFALRQLLIYLPISEKRQSLVKEYVDLWDSYRNGAPSKLRFSTLPVFPPIAAVARPFPNILSEQSTSPLLSPLRDGCGAGTSADAGSTTPLVSNLYVGPSAQHRPTPGDAEAVTAAVAAETEKGDGSGGSGSSQPHNTYVVPLRLVQALAFFELGFPADSSMGSKLWMDFFSVVQKLHAATLLQSLWRMYREEKAFDADKSRSFQEKMMIAILRRSFCKNRIKSKASFRCYDSFSEALQLDHEAFNPGTGHFDLLNRLRGHYSSLSPTTNFVIREEVVLDSNADTQSTAGPSTHTASQYVSRYLQQTVRRRCPSVSKAPVRPDIRGGGPQTPAKTDDSTASGLSSSGNAPLPDERHVRVVVPMKL